MTFLSDFGEAVEQSGNFGAYLRGLPEHRRVTRDKVKSAYLVGDQMAAPISSRPLGRTRDRGADRIVRATAWAAGESAAPLLS
jgi:hypothetical protein